MEAPGGGGAAEVYGAALAGRGFEPRKFIREPQTIVRVLSWVFAVVVFGCVTAEGYINSSSSAEVQCIFNRNASACQYAVAVGVLAFLACTAFLLLDVYVPFMSNAQERKYAVAADLGFSGLWTFLWFVCFCLLANQWSFTHDVGGIPEDAAHATIAFSFFSIATWGILTYFALGRFRRGVNDVTVPTYVDAPPPPDRHAFPPTYAPTGYGPAPYAPTGYGPAPYAPTTYTVPDMGPPQSYSPAPQTPADYQPPAY